MITDLPPCVGLWPAPWFEAHRRTVLALEHVGLAGGVAHGAAQACVLGRAASGEPHLSDFGRSELVGACLEALGELKRRGETT